MTYLNEDSVNLIADQIEYLRGLADGLHNTSPVAYSGILEAAELIDAALANIVSEPSTETATDTPEPPATALENTDTDGRWMDEHDIESTQEFLRGYDRLNFAFAWRESPDGWDYWYGVNIRLKGGYITGSRPLPTEARAKLLGYLEAHGVDVSEFTEPPAVEVTAATAEEIDTTGETNLAEALVSAVASSPLGALADPASLHVATGQVQQTDFGPITGDVNTEIIMDWGASNVDRPTIDATDEVTEADAIAAGEPEPTQEQIDAILNDETPFEDPQKRSYFGDTFA